MEFKTGDLVKVRHIRTNLFEEAVVVEAINGQYCLFFLKDGPVKYHWYDWYEALKVGWMYKIGDVLIQAWKDETYIILDTASKKAGYSFVTYELYCVQSKKYSYPVPRIVEREYERA